MKTERTFHLPPGADADIVAETVRAIIASSVSTESLTLETSPSPVIKATVTLPMTPEGENEPEGLWDTLLTSQLEDLPVESSELNILTLNAAIHMVCQRKRVPVGVLVKSSERLFKFFGFGETFPRLMGLPVFEVEQMEEDTVVVISSSSGSLGPLRADHGVVFHMTEKHDEQS